MSGFFITDSENDMKRIFPIKWLVYNLLMVAGCIQQGYAQKETLFHHTDMNQAFFAPAGAGTQGLTLNSLYRNFNDSTNYFMSLEIPVEKFNSAVGAYYLHNTSGDNQNIRSGLSYTAFIRTGENSNLRLGFLGNRHQQALSTRTFAYQEYKTDTLFYTADASLFLQTGNFSLGLTAHQLLPAKIQDQKDYTLFLGFRELRTNHWLRSSPHLLMRIRHQQELPEWRFSYTATIANFLMMGGTYYKNSDYLYGLHAGFKLFNTVWLTAATDFVDTTLPYRAIYEFGLRINIQKKRAFADKQTLPSEEEDEQEALTGF